MKYIILCVVSFVIGYNFDFIFRRIVRFIFKLKYREKKYFDELKIEKDEFDFYDYKFSKRDFED